MPRGDHLMSSDSPPMSRPEVPLEKAHSESNWGVGPPKSDERKFLRGPQRRFADLLHATRLFADILNGFRCLHFVGPCVTVFGSARFTEQQAHYQLARDVGARL